jgi:hypothetical protein
MIADDQMLSPEAVRAYHGALETRGVKLPRRRLSEGLKTTPASVNYEVS